MSSIVSIYLQHMAKSLHLVFYFTGTYPQNGADAKRLASHHARTVCNSPAAVASSLKELVTVVFQASNLCFRYRIGVLNFTLR